MATGWRLWRPLWWEGAAAAEIRSIYFKGTPRKAITLVFINRSNHLKPCQDEAKEARDSEREVPRGTEKYSVITSKESPSPQSEDWLAEVVSNESVA